MRVKPIKIGPWRDGVDTFHDPLHAVFQPGHRDQGHYERLSAGTNIDLDGEGYPEVRAGMTKLATASAGLRCFAALGLLIMQDGGTISKVDPSTGDKTSLVTGLSASLPVFFVEKAGKIFYSNGAAHGIITAAGAATNWGMSVPPVPTLGQTAGDLPAGRYRVCCALLDGNTVISGAPKAAAVTVDGTKDITVDLSVTDSNAANVRVYCSGPDGSKMYLVATVATGALPYTITDIKVSNTLLETQFLRGPQDLSAITAIAGVGKWRGHVLIWRGSRVARSFGNKHHLFRIGKRAMIWKVPYTVQAAGGSDDGPAFVATTRGMYRFSPTDEGLFSRKQMDSRKYAAGVGYVDAGKLGGVDGFEGEIPVFASDDGVVLGLPDGSIRLPQKTRVRWDVTGTTSSIIYREIGGASNYKPQTLVNLE